MKILILVLLGVMAWPTQQKVLDECKDKKVDLVVLIDESGSVNDERFEILKKFVRTIAKRSFIAPDQVQISVVTFGYNPHIKWTLNAHKTTGELLTAIDGLKKVEPEGGTYTHLALNKVKGILFSKSAGGRNDALKMVIIITDGPSRYEDKTKAAAAALHKAKITTIAVGVDNYDSRELNYLGSDPKEKYVFKTDKFEKLHSLAKKVAAVACAGYNAFGVCPAGGGMDRCCPDEQRSFEGSCYFFGSLLLVDYKTAEKACKAMNADLVQIDSYQEDEFLVQTLDHMKKVEKIKVATAYYTAWHSNGGSNWEWLSQEKPEYVPNRWYSSYPYSTASYGECMVMHSSYVPWKWLQVKCGVKYGFICES